MGLLGRASRPGLAATGRFEGRTHRGPMIEQVLVEAERGFEPVGRVLQPAAGALGQREKGPSHRGVGREANRFGKLAHRLGGPTEGEEQGRAEPQAGLGVQRLKGRVEPKMFRELFPPFERGEAAGDDLPHGPEPLGAEAQLDRAVTSRERLLTGEFLAQSRLLPGRRAFDGTGRDREEGEGQRAGQACPFRLAAARRLRSRDAEALR